MSNQQWYDIRVIGFQREERNGMAKVEYRPETTIDNPDKKWWQFWKQSKITRPEGWYMSIRIPGTLGSANSPLN